MNQPFSNGTEYMVWQETNCYQCKKCPEHDLVGNNPQCDIENELALAGVGDGMISPEIAARLNMIEFYVSGNPKAQPRPRAFARNLGGGKFAARVFDAGTAEGWKSCVALATKNHLPDEPMAEPLSVSLTFHLPRPKSHFGAKGLKPAAPKDHTGKPDLDNLAKAVMDALTQVGIWRDDSQVVILSLRKAWTEQGGGCCIEITKI